MKCLLALTGLVLVLGLPNQALGAIILDTVTPFKIVYIAIGWNHSVPYSTVFNNALSNIKSEINVNVQAIDAGNVPGQFSSFDRLYIDLQTIFAQQGLVLDITTFVLIFTTSSLNDPSFVLDHAIGLAVTNDRLPIPRLAIILGASQGQLLSLQVMTVATEHELGHLWGFNHETTSGCIMKQGVFSGVSFRGCTQFQAQFNIPPPTAAVSTDYSGLIIGSLGLVGALVVVLPIVAVVATRNRGSQSGFINPAFYQPGFQAGAIQNFQGARNVIWVNGRPMPIY